MNKKSGKNKGEKNTHTNLEFMYSLKSVIYRHTVSVMVLILICLNDLTAKKLGKKTLIQNFKIIQNIYNVNYTIYILFKNM